MLNGRWVDDDSTSDDFVVVGRADSAGSYRRDVDELEGSSFWAAATGNEEGEEDEEGEEMEEGAQEEGDFLDALQELLPELQEPGETGEQAEWRRVYTMQVGMSGRMVQVVVAAAAAAAVAAAAGML